LENRHICPYLRAVYLNFEVKMKQSLIILAATFAVCLASCKKAESEEKPKTEDKITVDKLL